MNSITIIGRLTADPELRVIASTGKSVATFTVAVDRRFQKQTDFFNVVVWEKQAENCANYLRKGSQCAVQGEMQQRSYDNNEGKKVYIWEVKAEQVQFLSKPAETSGYREVLGDDVNF